MYKGYLSTAVATQQAISFSKKGSGNYGYMGKSPARNGLLNIVVPSVQVILQTVLNIIGSEKVG